MNKKKNDEYYMKIALDLALKGRGSTNPNPVVGAIIVKKNKIIGKGYHKQAGGPHAERNALKQAGKKARGATLYVTLEPCNNYGRTPPCAPAIVAAGINRVVIAVKDPNPVNKNKGIKYLRKNNIVVDLGTLQKEAKEINEPYSKFIVTGMPWVTVKTAMSLDGKIATVTGASRWISGKKSRSVVASLRQEVDAVIIGKTTCIRDNPHLYSTNKSFYRIVLDSQAKTNPKANIAKMDNVIIAVTKKAPKRNIERLRAAGVKIEIVPSNRNGRIALRPLLKKLTRLSVMHVLVEGGGETIASAFQEGLVDKCYFFIAPKIIGGAKAPTPVAGRGINRIADAVSVRDKKVESLGEDILVTGYVHRNNYRNR